MPVCVGCGLKVVSGLLEIDPCGMCGQPDVGVVCIGEGCVDYVIPAMSLRPSGTITVFSVLGALSGNNASQIDESDFDLTYNSAAGIMTDLAAGGVRIDCPGMYTIHLTGGMLKDPNSVNKLIGGRCRILRGSVILGSNGHIAYNPEVDFSSSGGSGDGPEWSCSVIAELDAGEVITWTVSGVTSVAAVPVQFPSTVNLLTIARLGSARA